MRAAVTPPLVALALTSCPVGGGRHAVKMEGGENACGMAVDGVATDVGLGRMRLAKVVEGTNGMCVIDMSTSGNRMSIEENGCGYYHGASYQFTGTVTRVRG